jgi:hypothetical protein
VFVDKGGQLEGAAAPRPEEDQLTAVYAQIEALSRDLRGTHDELEQLRHAEAQLKVLLSFVWYFASSSTC